MSSRTSAAALLELPGSTWAGRVSDVLGALAALTVAWVASRYAHSAVAGTLGVATAVVFLFARGRAVPTGRLEVLAGPATRRLGATLVVAGRSAATGRPVGATWLTPLDVPADRLRRLGLILRAAHRKAGS